MIKSKLMKALLFSAFFVTATSTTAFAAEVSGQTTASQGQAAVDSKMLDKQQEIDRYLFEEHAKELEGKEFKITHTLAMDSYVEIGITPYSAANADYLYNKFGKDQIKVVEGSQAVTLSPETVYMQAPDTSVSSAEQTDTKAEDADKAADSVVMDIAVDDAVIAESGMAEEGVNSTKAPAAGTAEEDGRVYKEVEMTIMDDASNVTDDVEVLAYTTGAADTKTESSSIIMIAFASAAGAFVIIGGTIFYIRVRSKYSRKSL